MMQTESLYMALNFMPDLEVQNMEKMIQLDRSITFNAALKTDYLNDVDVVHYEDDYYDAQYALIMQ